MRKIVVSQFLTLDGIMEYPEKWSLPFLGDEELSKDLLDNFLGSDAILLGKTSYQFFEARWPTRTGALADRFNALPKHVVSADLQKAEWNNSSIIKANAIDVIRKMKEQSGKNLLVLGSYQLCQALMSSHLVDEYRLQVYPLTAGSGRRLFHRGIKHQTLNHTQTKSFGNGVVSLTYQVIQSKT